MPARLRVALERALDRGLRGAGTASADLPIARAATLDWAKLRARALRRRRGVVAGVAVTVTSPGRAELLPVERLVAGPGETTVEVLVSALSPGTERAQWLRLPNAQPSLPFTPGYSGAGRVLAAGGGAGDPPVGSLVAVCRLPHASVATVSSAWTTPVPEGVTPEAAALVYLAVIAGYGVERTDVEPGAPACIVGAGPIGALAQRLLLLRDPGPVTVVARTRRAEASALAHGAASFSTAAEVGSIEAEVVIEATGDPEGLAAAVAAARPGARVVLLGSPRGLTRAATLAEAHRKGVKLVGAHISALAVEARSASDDPFRLLASSYLDALDGGRIDVADLVGAAVDPREIGHLYRGLGAGAVTAAHLDWRRLPREERVQSRALVSTPKLPPRRPRVRTSTPAVPARNGSRLRFAVIGCGDIGLGNARAVAASDGAELVLCHDSAPGLAEAVSRRVGGEVAPTLEQALDPARVDAVFLSVPHDLHAPLIVQAAEAGLHVVVEKPLASDLAAAREAVEAARGAGVALSVCFPYRYEPAVVAARELVLAGALGSMRGASVLFHADKPDAYWLGGFSGRARSDWRGSLERAGGGVLIMNLTHYVDLLRHVTGLEPARVAATSRARAGSEVEEAITATIEFSGGAIGSLLASAATRGAPGNRFEAWGESGSVRFEPEPALYTERAVDGVVPGRWSALPEDPAVNPRRLFVDHFCAAVLESRPPDVTAGDGLAVQAFVDAAYRSAGAGGRPVEIEAVEP
jgi:predicted dehydrogenase/NADPH:quinone reductase-like Zn-dependent oxidoreductase